MKKTYLIGVLALLLIAGTASANHSWGKYHWDLSTADTVTNPLNLGDNVSSVWDGSLVGASNDWNLSVLKNTIVVGESNSNCDPTSGRVEICNDAYGNNGWLGIASVWATRGKSNHITQGVVKVNDTYFNTSEYNTSAWRNLVMCQEIGHTFGLDHQDENFDNANLGTCMDYTSNPESNQHPNQHDYDQMESIYSHLNSTDGGGGGKPDKGNNGKGKPSGVGANIDHNDPSSWGRAIRQDARGNDSLFERDLGNGQVLVTHVTWIK